MIAYQTITKCGQVLRLRGGKTICRASLSGIAADPFDRVAIKEPISQQAWRRPYSSTRGRYMNDGGISKARETTEVDSDIPENQYHFIADATFDQILVYLSPVEDSDDLEDVDIDSSQGVMAIKLGAPYGTWVINKQTPNRQIWWSSPISGPLRFELPDDVNVEDAMKEEDPATIVSRWKSTKDGSDLLSRLRDELFEKVKIDIFEE